MDNTTQLLESIRSKGRRFVAVFLLGFYESSSYTGADLTQLTNFLDGTLSHIRSNDSSLTPSSTTVGGELRPSIFHELLRVDLFGMPAIEERIGIGNNRQGAISFWLRTALIDGEGGSADPPKTKARLRSII